MKSENTASTANEDTGETLKKETNAGDATRGCHSNAGLFSWNWLQYMLKSANAIVFQDWGLPSLVQSFDWFGWWGNMRDDSTEILFQSFLKEAIMGSSGMVRDVQSLMLFIQHFLCWPVITYLSRYPAGWFGWFGRGLWVRDLPGPCEFSSLDSWQRRFLCCVGRKGGWSCSTPSHWSGAPCSRCRDISPVTCSQKPWSFSQSRQAWSLSHSPMNAWYARTKYNFHSGERSDLTNRSMFIADIHVFCVAGVLHSWYLCVLRCRSSSCCCWEKCWTPSMACLCTMKSPASCGSMPR